MWKLNDLQLPGAFLLSHTDSELKQIDAGGSALVVEADLDGASSPAQIWALQQKVVPGYRY